MDAASESAVPDVSETGGLGDPLMAPRRRLPGLVFVALGLLAAVAVVLFLQPWRPHAVPAAATPAISVENGRIKLTADAPQWRYLSLAVAALEDPLPPVPAPGRVVMDEKRAAPVFAPVAGRVEQIAVELGQPVKAGERLVAVRSSSLPELGREVESARAALAVKTSNLGRVKDLVGLHALPEKELQVAEQERHDAELALSASEGKRKSLRVGALDASGFFWITAPRAGHVVERHAMVGQEVGPDRPESLITIADLDELLVVADVIETDAAGLKVGQPAQVLSPALPGDGVAGVIAYVAEVVDPLRHTVAVRVRVANKEHHLRPNAFVQVAFSASPERRVVVPAEAVVTDDQSAVVFVKNPAGHLERRPVEVGRTRDGRTEIRSGLRPGDTFVVKGALLLLNAIDLGG